VIPAAPLLAPAHRTGGSACACPPGRRHGQLRPNRRSGPLRIGSSAWQGTSGRIADRE